MKKLFRYLVMMISDIKKLSDAVNTASSPSELDEIVLKRCGNDR